VYLFSQETYGEDPVLTGAMAKAYVEGLNGYKNYPAATAVCKHFDAYAGPENIPSSRQVTDNINLLC